MIGLLFTALSISASAKTISSKEFYRLEECAKLIDLAGKFYWPSLQRFSGPWVYVTMEGQYLVNYPQALNGFKNVDITSFKKSSFKPFRIQWRDKGQITLTEEDHSSDPVFVFNSVSTTPGDLEYKNPVTYASSIEIVKKVVPLADTEDWMSLFLHEVFHQFQFSDKNVFNHYSLLKTKGLYIDSGELAEIYSKNDWFKTLVLAENRILLKARKEKNHILKRKIISEFFDARKKRRMKYLKEFGKNISEAEALWEMIEGGARYFEYATFRVLQTADPNSQLTGIDPLYGSNKRYRNKINLEKMEDH